MQYIMILSSQPLQVSSYCKLSINNQQSNDFLSLNIFGFETWINNWIPECEQACRDRWYTSWWFLEVQRRNAATSNPRAASTTGCHLVPQSLRIWSILKIAKKKNILFSYILHSLNYYLLQLSILSGFDRPRKMSSSRICLFGNCFPCLCYI